MDPLYERLKGLRDEMVACEARFTASGGDLSGEGRASAANLLHYLILRGDDLRSLQEELAERGLSSLGRSESHVLSSLETVLGWLGPARTPPPASGIGGPTRVTRREGRALLVERARALFGAPPPRRSVRIMVTAPDEAADRYELVRDLLAGGMDCLRINCAHGTPAVWERTIEHLRRAERERGVSCTLLMDLPGPRARTGALEEGPRVVKVRPERDELGRVTRPARLWLRAEGGAGPPEPADAVLPLPAPFVAALAAGDLLELQDAREATRMLRVGAGSEAGRWAEAEQTCYVVTGTRVRHLPAARGGREVGGTGLVGPLPALARRLRLAVGDRLLLTRAAEPGRDAVRDAAGMVVTPARIPCTPAEVLDHVRAGEPIWFDDGRIGGRVESVGADGVAVTITHTKIGGGALGAEKGINLPDSDLRLPALMPGDLEILPFVAAHADLVGYSFASTPEGVEELAGRLAAFPGDPPGMVLKIETVRAFERLPEMLLAALRHPPVGVMIARGDLAVECGFARLAEVQEEILWLCEAAHIPVIWATQVLDGLAKSGRPSRAEVTDAALAERAECVMLNKGPYIVDAVHALDSILTRMQAHQEKKQSLLRELDVAGRFLASRVPPR